jgi:ElaB/YqjD/DUF883 family membrane-anchored ribosome-binding protein
VDNEPELEVIHHQMEQTRASLADKLDTLENEVLGTVHQATSAVANTVEDVKSVVGTVTETIEETVESVKETLNLKEQVRRHPWPMVGGAFAVGFLGGWMLGPSHKEEAPEALSPEPYRPPLEPLRPVHRPRTESTASAQEAPTIVQKLQALAVGTLMNVLDKVVTDVVPENVKPDVESLIDDITVKLGGKPIHDSAKAESEENQHPSHERGTGNGKRKAGEMAGTMGTAEGQGQESVGKSDRRRSHRGQRGL